MEAQTVENTTTVPLGPHLLVVTGEGVGLADRCDWLTMHGYRVTSTRWGNGVYDMVLRERPALAIFGVEQAYRHAAWRTITRLSQTDATRDLPLTLCACDGYLLAPFVQRYATLVEPFEGRALLTLVTTLLGLSAPPRHLHPAHAKRLGVSGAASVMGTGAASVVGMASGTS